MTNTMQLTFTQAKIVINSLGRDVLETFVADLNNQPEFMHTLGLCDDLGDMLSLYEVGCASNAHKAVYYYEAQQCMIKDSDSIEAQLEAMDYTITFTPSEESFSQFCSNCCVLAVESYIAQFGEILEALEGEI